MPVPSAITDLSSTAASNSPAGSDPISTNLDDYLRAIQAIQRAESLNKGWERYNHTVTWLSSTSFSVPGDLTSLYTVGRRLKATLAGPTTAYSTITASSFGGGVTTVTVTNDSTALSSPISEMQLGLELGSLLRNGAYLFDGIKVTTQAATDDSDKPASTAFVQDVAALVGGVVGSVRGGRMSITTAGVSGTFAADEIVVAASLGGSCHRLGNFSQSVNLSTTGVGGMDTGTAPVSGFVSIYAIYKPSDGSKGLLACSVATSSGAVYGGANMPTGYTESALVGVWPTNSSSQFVAGYLRDRRVDFARVEAIDSDSGNPTTYTSLSLASIVPSIATRVFGNAGSGANDGAHLNIAADANGIGQVNIMLSVTSTEYQGFWTGVPFSMVLATAQTIYYRCRAAGQPVRIEITGYTF